LLRRPCSSRESFGLSLFPRPGLGPEEEGSEIGVELHLRPDVRARAWAERERGPSIDKVYLRGYTCCMIEIRKTDVFARWLDGLRGCKARARME
jgi:hypothetical protein